MNPSDPNESNETIDQLSHLVRASEQAASTQDAFDGELAAHRAELEGRDDHAAGQPLLTKRRRAACSRSSNGPRPGCRS